ncbi:hypothetical protein RchiOBHm_Chr1g0324161 [Rosa chinensis]|uniref:Uncharacterized protein n=1 Tax=Rosa chinensis TaxID=74649 RepID=A0A2P6S9Q3_ROSCH|nr:hypothetical protein RchiOBHm_Chr1g0324161 [Rosa chinensis]
MFQNYKFTMLRTMHVYIPRSRLTYLLCVYSPGHNIQWRDWDCWRYFNKAGWRF